MSQILARDTALQWERVKEQGHESEGRQKPRKVWAVTALKPQLTEQEWGAACRAVKECAPAFDAMRRAFDNVPVDQSSSDYGMAARVSAVRCLEGLRQAAFARTGASKAPACVEWVVQMWTLSDIAVGLGFWRRMGARAPVPDLRPTKPFVRLVLLGMAAHYEHCDAELAAWRGL